MASGRCTDVQARPTECLDVTSVTSFSSSSHLLRRCAKRLWPHDDHGEGYPSSSRYSSPNFGASVVRTIRGSRQPRYLLAMIVHHRYHS